MIANIIAGLTAEGSLAEQVRELITDPLAGGPALIEAINLAFPFSGTNPSTRPHVSYHMVVALPGQSSVAVAIRYMNRIAAMTPAHGGRGPYGTRRRWLV